MQPSEKMMLTVRRREEALHGGQEGRRKDGNEGKGDTAGVSHEKKSHRERAAGRAAVKNRSRKMGERPGEVSLEKADIQKSTVEGAEGTERWQAT